MDWYIPEVWLADKNNRHKVRGILGKKYLSDVVLGNEPTAEEIAQELRDIGETIIAQKVLEGYFKADS